MSFDDGCISIENVFQSLLTDDTLLTT